MFSFFDRVYCISLPNAGRRMAMRVRLDGLGIVAQFVYASQPGPLFHMTNMRRNPRAEFGANLSHIKAVVQAIADRAERPLFLEDDVVFRPDASERLSAALAELPQDWDVLYMGGHPRSTAVTYSANLVKVSTFSCAEAYSINGKALLGFYDAWLDRIGSDNAMYDFILGEYAAAHNGYCVYPLLCDQVIGLSQISGKIDDKRALVERGWLNNLAT